MSREQQVTTQKDFLKGLNAATGKLTVEPNSVTRISNLIYTKRGALKTCDGTAVISEVNDNLLIPDPSGRYDNYVAAMCAASVDSSGIRPLAFTYGPAGGGFMLSDFSTNPSTILTNAAQLVAENKFRLPQMVPFSSTVIVCIGNDHVPLYPAGGAIGSPGGGLWAPLTAAPGETAPVGAAHGCYHLGALWLWNTSPVINGLDGPSTLRMSDLSAPGNQNLWPNINAITVDAGDGTQGQGMASFTISDVGIAPQANLVLFKDFTTYLVSGVFGETTPTAFGIQKAQTDMGCIAPRSILFVPGFGIMRMTHLGIALFDGLRDKLVSEEIRPYIFGGEPDITPVDFVNISRCYSCLTVNPPMYCMFAPVQGGNGFLSRAFCYDLVLKAWSVVDLPFPALTSVAQIRLPGTRPLTCIGESRVLSSATTPEKIRQWQAGDQDWDNGLAPEIPNYTGPVSWSFRTTEVSSKSPTQRTFFRKNRLRVKIAASTTANDTSISQAVELGGYQSSVTSRGTPEYVFPQSLYGSARYGTGHYGSVLVDMMIPIEVGSVGKDAIGFSANARYSGSGPVEIYAVDWVTEDKEQGANTRAS